MNKIVLLVFALATFLYACNGNETATTELDGAKLYQIANCSTCHGAFGKPILAQAKDLTDPSITLERRIEVITNGSKNNSVMVAFSPRYTDAQIKAIAEYTMNFVNE